MFMSCTGSFSPIMGRKEVDYVIRSLFMSYAQVMDFIEKMPRLMSLLASNVIK